MTGATAAGGARRGLIVIALCTRDREAQLRVAMASLDQIDRPEGYDVTILITENAPEAKLPGKLSDVRISLPVVFALEPEPGFSSVRNRAVEEALKLGADWIAWFDDDQTAHHAWLTTLIDATERFPRNLIFTGRQRRLSARRMDLIERWNPDLPMLTGSDGRRGGTCNALMHRSVFAADGHGLRFDPDFNFTGGEDTDLLNRWYRSYGPVTWVEEALVFEEIVPERDSLDYKIMREASVHWTIGHIAIKQLGPVEGRIKCFRHLLQQSYDALYWGLAWLFTALPRPAAARRAKRDFRIAIARWRGYWAAIMGQKVTRYPKLAGDKAIAVGKAGRVS